MTTSSALPSQDKLSSPPAAEPAPPRKPRSPDLNFAFRTHK